MYFTKVKRLKELAFELSALSAEILAIFADDDREQRQNEEELKKSPKGGQYLYRSIVKPYSGKNSIAN